MGKRSRKFLLPPYWWLVLALLNVCYVQAQDVGETVVRRGTAAEDYYAAGGTVEVRADVIGDVVVAGGTVIIDGNIKADVIAAGGQVNVRGVVGDDIRAAGGTVLLDAQVGSDAIAAGGNVRLQPDAVVRGRAWLAGGDVEVAGAVDKELRAAAEAVTISGHIKGDVTVQAGRLDILPGARIEGNLNYVSPKEAQISPKAQIQGTVSYRQLEWEEPVAPPLSPLFMVTMAVAGVVLYLLFPGFSARASNTIISAPWKSLGLGFALLIVTPIAAAILMATVLGLWVGLVTLALYFVALAVGFLLGVFVVAEGGARLFKLAVTTKGRRIALLLAAFVVVALIRLIPFVGGLVCTLLLFSGLGGGVLQVSRAYRAA